MTERTNEPPREVWVVSNEDGPEFVTDLREVAMNHASECAGVDPDRGPWRVSRYIADGLAVVDEMCIYCDQPIKAGQPAGSAAHAECEQQEAEFSEAMARELTQPCSWMTAVRAAQAYRELWHEAAAGLVDRQHRLARSIITEAAAELDRLAEELRQSHTTPDGEWPTEEIDHAQTEYVRLRYLADGLRGVQARLDQQVLAVLWQGE